MNAPHDTSAAGAHKQDDPAPVCAPLSAETGIVLPVTMDDDPCRATRAGLSGPVPRWETFGPTPPTPASEAVVQDAALKDHEIRELVNNLTGIAKAYYGTDQLRERISTVVLAALRSLPQQQTGERE